MGHWDCDGFSSLPTDIAMVIEFEDVWSISVCRNAVNISYIDKTSVPARFRDLLIPPEKNKIGGQVRKSGFPSYLLYS